MTPLNVAPPSACVQVAGLARSKYTAESGSSIDFSLCPVTPPAGLLPDTD